MPKEVERGDLGQWERSGTEDGNPLDEFEVYS
jgi:hypothetical protein